MQRLSLRATLSLLKKIARILAVSAGMLVLLIVGIVCLGTQCSSAVVLRLIGPTVLGEMLSP